MGNILIRDVPEDVHRELIRQAEYSGRSLQQYLLLELERLSKMPTLDEWIDRVSRQSGGHVGLREAVEAVREDRDQR